MKLIAPDYYPSFTCIASACRHTCCVGWEIDVDKDSLERFRRDEVVYSEIDETDTPHIRLREGERCPFLNPDGLCDMILKHGEGYLCDICRDHPRFRNYFTDRTEIGLGLVCEEAARIILFSPEPMRLITLEDDGKKEDIPEDEMWLSDLRDSLLSDVKETGPRARLLEYLIYRHLPDALYDGRTEERISFIGHSFEEITSLWDASDGKPETVTEIVRQWSYDVEYDEEELEKRIAREEKKDK